MRTLLSLLLLILMSQGLLARTQGQSVEELLSSLQTAKEDTEKYQLYIQLSQHFQSKQTELCVNYSLMAYNIAYSNQWMEAGFDALRIGLQQVLYGEAKPRSGMKLFQLIRRIPNKAISKDKQIIRELLETRLDFLMNDRSRVFDHLENAESILAQTESNSLKTWYQFESGNYHLINGDTLTAVGVFKLALENETADEFTSILFPELYLNIATSYLHLEDPEKSILYGQTLLTKFDLKDISTKHSIELLLIKAYAELSQFSIFESSIIKLKKEIQGSRNHKILDELYFLLVQHAGVIEYDNSFDEAIKYCEDEGRFELQRDLVLLKLANDKNNLSTREVNNLNAQLNTIYQNLVKSNSQIDSKLNKLSLEHEELIITLAEKESQLKNSKQQLRSQIKSSYWYMGFLLLVFTISGVLLFLLYRIQERRTKLANLLQERNKELRTSRSYVRDLESRLVSSEAELEKVLNRSVEEIKKPFSNIEHLIASDNLEKESLIENITQVDFLLGEMEEYRTLRSEEKSSSVINLQESVVRVLENLQTEIDALGLSIEVSELPSVAGNEIQIRQLFQNLLYNCMQTPSEDRLIRIDYHEANDQHCFSIKNPKAQMGDQLKQAVNELFIDYPLGQLHPVAGKALSIVKKIIGEHQGNIWLETVNERDVVYHFSLPKSMLYSAKPM